MMERSRKQREPVSVSRFLLALLPGVALICVLALGMFAFEQVRAIQTLEERNARNLQTLIGTKTGNLSEWMERHTSKRDTQDWCYVLNEVSSGYVQAQVENFFTSGAETPLERDLRDEGEWTEAGPWQGHDMFQQELHQFLSEQRELLDLVHRLCESEDRVYIPIRDQGINTALGDHFKTLVLTRLLHLQAIDAIRCGDSKAVGAVLKSLDAIQLKFALPCQGGAYLNRAIHIQLAQVMHRALDNGSIVDQKAEYWLTRMRDRLVLPDQIAGTESSDGHLVAYGDLRAGNTNILQNRTLLPSFVLAMEPAEVSNLEGDQSWTLIEQDYCQSAIVRLAMVLAKAHGTTEVKSLADLPAKWLSWSDRVNGKREVFKYEWNDELQEGILFAHRHTPIANFNLDYQLPRVFKFSFAPAPQVP